MATQFSSISSTKQLYHYSFQTLKFSDSEAKSLLSECQQCIRNRVMLSPKRAGLKSSLCSPSGHHYAYNSFILSLPYTVILKRKPRKLYNLKPDSVFPPDFPVSEFASVKFLFHV